MHVRWLPSHLFCAFCADRPKKILPTITGVTDVITLLVKFAFHVFGDETVISWTIGLKIKLRSSF